ncbi:MAG: SDR family NAD(P)-dependent oxidoreductase, partial [Oscillospiraceae bacterium]|nr:SDR family NAD(P)-dependent oxidoreductase [Oscillospiraceae bacterium]
AFQHVPYIGVYAATKAFVLSFSRSLNQELKKQGIKVLAVCPHWTKTEFFDRADKKNGVITYYNFYTDKIQVVSNAIKHMKKGKDLSLTSLQLKLQVLAASLLPKKLVMKIWLNSQNL